jgi:hypothetical protein
MSHGRTVTLVPDPEGCRHPRNVAPILHQAA